MREFPQVYVTETARVSLAGADLPPVVVPHVYTRAEFGDIVGRWPVGTELDDMNCPDAGLIGHLKCGCCIIHQLPRKVCGCLAPIGAPTDNLPRIRVATAEDPGMIGVDLERIEGWPGLEAFSGGLDRVPGELGMPNTLVIRHQIEQRISHLFHELLQRGALVRGFNGAWRYDGRGR